MYFRIFVSASALFAISFVSLYLRSDLRCKEYSTLYHVSPNNVNSKHISIPNSSFRFFSKLFFSIVSIVIVIIIAQCSQFKKSLQYFMIINSFMQYFREKSEFIFVQMFLQQLLCKAQDFSKHFNPSLRNSILGINSPEMPLG